VSHNLVCGHSFKLEYVLDILDRGHILACHSSTHQLDKIYSSPSKFVADVEQFEDELKGIIGEERFNSLGKYIRFPGGTDTNGYLSRTEAKEYIQKMRAMGYKVYDWTALIEDTEGNSTASEFISCMEIGLAKAKQNGDPLIVLMHDKDHTTQALDQMITHLIDQGYYFDTLEVCPEYTTAE
jgi:peptidoglycan/xylan/chitin deacetylase (PgdA/CDA1 family)